MASLGGPGILGQALNLGKAGLGAVVRTIGDIIGGMGLGKWAKVGLDLAHGDVGGASRAFGDLVPHVGGTNFIAGLMRAVPVKLISTAMKFLAGKMKSFVAGQQSSGSAAGVAPAGAGELAWIKALMSSLGAPASAANIASLTHWIARETPWPPVARNNPLNTTLNAPGATIFNRVGVKNYPTAAEGVGANANTLLGGYPNIVAALRAGHGLGGGGSFSAELLKWSGGGYSSVGTGGIGGGLAMVGEYGRELIRLPQGSHVYPHSQGTVGALGTGSPAKLQIEWIGGNASDEFITWLRKNIRIRGGDVQSVLGWG
jgi:hypothetical protein